MTPTEALVLAVYEQEWVAGPETVMLAAAAAKRTGQRTNLDYRRVLDITGRNRSRLPYDDMRQRWPAGHALSAEMRGRRESPGRLPVGRSRTPPPALDRGYGDGCPTNPASRAPGWGQGH